MLELKTVINCVCLSTKFFAKNETSKLEKSDLKKGTRSGPIKNEKTIEQRFDLYSNFVV